MEYTQEELDALIKAVTEEFQEIAKAESSDKSKEETKSDKSGSKSDAVPPQEMKKEESGDEKSDKTDAEGPVTKDPMPEATKEDPVVEASGSGTGSESSSSSSSGSESSSSSGSESSSSGSESSDGSLEDLYCQLDVESLKLHIEAALNALLKVAGGEGSESTPEEAPVEEAVDPGMAAAQPAGAPGMYKSEDGVTEAEIAEAEKYLENLEKSKGDLEAKVADLEKKLQSQDKSLEDLANQLTKALNLPVERKAVTGDDKLKKSEKPVALSHEQILNKLSVKAQDPDLKKSERDLIDSYVLNQVLTQELSEFLNK